MNHKSSYMATILVVFLIIASVWGLAAAEEMDSTAERQLTWLPAVLKAFGVVSDNLPPYVPSAPSPASGAINQSSETSLSWTGGDPDGDFVLYSVYFAADDSTPDMLVADGQTATIFDPGALIDDTHYYWQIVAQDEHGLVTTGPVWDFTTGTVVNNPPYTPSNPSPADDAIDQSIYAVLGWTGGDPDGDTVTYDVYFEAATNPPTALVSTNQAATLFDPGTLSENTQFYWQIVARDVYGAETIGPVWDFTTGEYVPSDRILIPAGEFQMGCDWDHNGGYACPFFEIPLHTVFLDAYQIDAKEVTNGQYAQCVASGVCSVPRYSTSNTRAAYYGNADFADYPVIFVDWYQAHDYCLWAGGRLPSEAEWEKAARGSSDTRAFPWGDSLPNCDTANYASEFLNFCVGDTSMAGSYPANASPYGVLDMSGNVWEWVNDWYSDSYYDSSPDLNPTGPADGLFRVKRGGAWNTIDIGIRVAERSQDLPTDEFDYVGFRCAYTP